MGERVGVLGMGKGTKSSFCEKAQVMDSQGPCPSGHTLHDNLPPDPPPWQEQKGSQGLCSFGPALAGWTGGLGKPFLIWASTCLPSAIPEGSKW